MEILGDTIALVKSLLLTFCISQTNFSKMEEQIPWTFAGVWNEALDEEEKREHNPRNYLWASELYKSDIDIIYNLRGVEVTNPPNARSRRKFQAGNIWEWLVGLILENMGMLQSTQDRIKYSVKDGLLEVSGKIDFLVGGQQLNKEKALEKLQLLEDMHFPAQYIRAGRAFIHKYGDRVLQEKILELKSVSSFAFDQVERTMKPLRGHDLQLFHYTRGMNKQGAIIYICRDDTRMIEMPILAKNPVLEERYVKKMEAITEYYNSEVDPPKEEFLIFDEEAGRFSKNFNIEYSSYLTRIYGYDIPTDYSDIAGKMATRFNRVLSRVKNGDKMTKLNLEVIEEIKGYGFDPDTLVSKISDTATIEEED